MLVRVVAFGETPRHAARPKGLLALWAAYRTGEGAEMGEEVAAEDGDRAAIARAATVWSLR